MDSFPIFLPLTGSRVVVVGATPAALAKARLALKAGAQVTILAPEGEDVTWEADRAPNQPILPGHAYRPVDLEGARLAYAATGSAEMDAMVASEARRRGVLINVVDRPELCDFLTPAIVDRGAVVVAIGTGGASPVLARRVRAAIDRLLPSRLGGLATLAEGFREAVARALPDGDTRRRFWERFMDGEPARAVLAGDTPRARSLALRLLNGTREMDEDAEDPGVVHLVGAGPGDPELLTIKAQRLLQDADVIIHDDLVGEGVLDLARRDARRISVGKRAGRHSMDQGAIGTLLVREAKGGRVVVRLKGGDPAVFGRLSEEIATLDAARTPWTIVPGITAASAAAATMGIPLTDRDHAQSVTFATAHPRGDRAVNTGRDDWAALARAGGTLALYMGLGRAREAAQGLISGGLSPETPVAVAMDVGGANQRIAKGALMDLPSLVADLRDRDPKAPGLLLVGEVARAAGRIPAHRPARAAQPSWTDLSFPAPFGATDFSAGRPQGGADPFYARQG
ncbi:MAG: siroheme synthase CysG [Rhodospirillum sp.]|nr:siroheme synthase CysG [Rhodospirillum sp.]MCF8488515.1 siroheme synthase CysG [Rhodospirillum sp.]MCF8499260.1 siroheme synthase CysG [Rhodospirillum sp.]